MTCRTHWFSVYRMPGLRSPTCVRYGCDAPNPRPLTAEERADYDSYMADVAANR